jgi:hypothetical protein
MAWEKEELDDRIDPKNYSWIKVKQHFDLDPYSFSTPQEIEAFVEHHKKETEFLINEVRQLSLALRESWKEIERRGACEHVYNMRERRDGKLVDFCFKCRGAKQS